MPPPRWRFQEELQTLEDKVQRLGAEARGQLGQAVAALAAPADYDAIIAGDEEVDRRYVEVERSVLQLFALQTPVASDLRLLTALLHIGLHLERVGDMAVNIAKLARLEAGRPPDPTVQRQLQQMGTMAMHLVATAMDALGPPGPGPRPVAPLHGRADRPAQSRYARPGAGRRREPAGARLGRPHVRRL